MSLLLVFEVDFFIKYLKFVRIFTVLNGVIYNFLFLLAFIKFLDILNDWDGEKIEFSQFFMAMMLSYNLLIHVGFVPVNVVI